MSPKSPIKVRRDIAICEARVTFSFTETPEGSLGWSAAFLPGRKHMSSSEFVKELNPQDS